MRTEQPDAGYHEKVVKGLIVPTLGVMTESEERALLQGRYRGDSRRLDSWVLMDAVPIQPGDWAN